MTSSREGPVVWESYLRPNEVFIKPKKWPIYWDDEPDTLQALCPPVEGMQPPIISSFSTNYSSNSDGLNQPFTHSNYPTGPVADQNGNYLRYEVGLNQSYFTYVGHFRYFKPRTQKRSVERYIHYVQKHGEAPPASVKRDAKYFQELPKGAESYLDDLPDYARQGIVEWKAAWKILDGDDIPERFYRHYAYFMNPDGTCTGPFKVGLVGFHIHRYTPFGHVGATFEQVDNTDLQPAYSRRQVFGAAGLPHTPRSIQISRAGSRRTIPTATRSATPRAVIARPARRASSPSRSRTATSCPSIRRSPRSRARWRSRMMCATATGDGAGSSRVASGSTTR